MTQAPVETKPPSLPLRLFLFGIFRLERGERILNLATRKCESLLAYLVLHPESHSREKLAALLWGDSPDEQARVSLRTALATIRKTLGNDILVADRETVHWNPQRQMWVDVRAFEQIATEDPLAAMRLYHSDFLLDFYDEWVVPERERLHSLYLDTTMQLVQQARSESKYARAIELARRILENDPTNEQAHQHLMFCYAATGNRSAALKQYVECNRVLRKELSVEPSRETTALYRKILVEETGDKSKEAMLSNLPISLTSFVGRAKELEELKALVEETRLATLVGAGGCGKTRLAIQIATEFAAMDRFKHGVWWVDLSALNDPALVTQSVAKVFNLGEAQGTTLIAALTNYLRAKEFLLVIDNCEHLLSACAHLIGILLSVCPKSRVLATSRESLNIGGETIWRVPSLSMPDRARVPPLAQLRQYDAVQLFVDRAQTVAANWRLIENAVPTAQVCARLDGIPLAIELAAAQLKVMSAREIAAGLDDRFNLLTGGSRTALPRYQTLRATMDWSYDLLSDAERALLRRLSVFAGGFSFDAVEVVCWSVGVAGSLPRPHIPTLDLLTSLNDKSLVVVETHGDGTRYRLLETVRQYTREKLCEANEAQVYCRQHYDWFLHLAEQADSKIHGPQQLEWRNQLEQEIENLRAALAWSLDPTDHADRDRAMHLAGALVWFWTMCGYASEARTWLERSLETSSISPSARAKALMGLGIMEYARHGTPAKCLAVLEESLALYRQQGDKWHIALVASFCGIGQNDRSRANALFDEARSIAEELGDEWLAAGIDIRQGLYAVHCGDPSPARALNESALYHARLSGDRWLIGVALSNLGDVVLEQGDLERAELSFAESLEFYRELNNRRSMSNVIYGLGQVASRRHNSQQAEMFFKQALTLRNETGHIRGVLECLGELCKVAAMEQQYERAARLLGAIATLCEMLTGKDHRAYADDVRATRAQLGEQLFDRAHAEGRAMSVEQAIEYAMEKDL